MARSNNSLDRSGGRAKQKPKEKDKRKKEFARPRQLNRYAAGTAYTNMVEQIRQTQTLTESEKHQLFGWGQNIFGVESLNLRWRPKELHFLLYSGSRPLSHVGILKHQVMMGGRRTAVGGVGGVVTVPDAQARGYARRLMEHAAEFFQREWKVDAGLLFCLTKLEPYYEVLGWQTVTAPVLIDQPNGQIASPLSVMILPLEGQRSSHETIELCSLPW